MAQPNLRDLDRAIVEVHSVSIIGASSLIIAKIISPLGTKAEPEILVKLIAKVSFSSKELSGVIGISMTLLV